MGWRLKLRYPLQAVLARADQPLAPVRQTSISGASTQSLAIADQIGPRSIALPALSSGIGRLSFEHLHQPLEDKVATISRAQGSVSYPANVLLVRTMNRCQYVGKYHSADGRAA